MEQFRKLGQTCRQHYEKLILSAALLVFAGAVYYLYQASIAERAAIRKIPEGYDNLKVKGVHPADMTTYTAALKQLEKPPGVDFSHPHFLFNPLVWESRGGGEPRKLKTGDEIGPRAMRLVKITPLLMSIAYGSASVAGTEVDAVVSGYWTFTTNELFAANSPKRLVRAFLSVGQTNSPAPFIIHEVKGEPKEPSDVVAELKVPAGEQFHLAPGKPYSRVLGHEAELRYLPSPNKPYVGLRKGASVEIDGQIYKIVDITPNAVVLSDDSNGKQYSITAFGK